MLAATAAIGHWQTIEAQPRQVDIRVDDRYSRVLVVSDDALPFDKEPVTRPALNELKRIFGADACEVAVSCDFVEFWVADLTWLANSRQPASMSPGSQYPARAPSGGRGVTCRILLKGVSISVP